MLIAWLHKFQRGGNTPHSQHQLRCQKAADKILHREPREAEDPIPRAGRDRLTITNFLVAAKDCVVVLNPPGEGSRLSTVMFIAKKAWLTLLVSINNAF